MARVFATLDRNALGPNLDLEQGGLIVTFDKPSATINRLARGTIGVSTGKVFFEAAFYGEGALLNQTAVGIVQGTHLTSKYVGEQDGYGLKVGNGGIYRAGVLLENTDPAGGTDLIPVGKKVYIGILLDMSARTCSWYVDGSLRHKVTGIAKAPWYPAVTVSGLNAFDLRCYVNFGQYGFAYPQDGTATASGAPIAGWYSDADSALPLYLCPRNSAGFTSLPGDSLPSTTFLPRIANADAATVSTRSSVWQWGTGNSGSSYGELEIDNADGLYDVLAGRDMRDQVARFVAVNAGGSYDAANVAFTAIVDDVKCIGESKLRIAFKDLQTALERPLQRRIFPPWADPGVAFRPLPITLGACRNVAPLLEDQVLRKYRLHDAPITNLAAVRDKGTLLDPYSSPPQYVPTNDLQGVVLQAPPVGLLTVDVSSEGSQYVIPGIADILHGCGAFTAWSNPSGPPDGYDAPAPQPDENWVFGGGANNELRRLSTTSGYGMPQNYVAALSTRTIFNPQAGFRGAHLRYDAAILKPGKTYRIQFKYVRSFGSPSNVIDGMSYGLLVRSEIESGDPTGAISPHLKPLVAPQFGTQGTAYTFTYTVPPGAARKLYFVATTAQAFGVSSGMGGGAGVYFYDVKVELLGEAEQARPLVGITLEEYWSEIFQRAGVPAAAWVRADCAAIDAATNAKFGVHIRDPITVLQALRLPLDTYGAAMFTDAQGRFRVRRLVDPSNEKELVATFTASDIPRGVTPRNDLAPGLTTTVGARRNWQAFNDSDFVTDYLLVPAAIRAQFKRRNQFVRNSPANVMPTYRFASSGTEFDSLFDDADEAQDEILRVVTPYSIDRQRSPLSKYHIPLLPRFLEFTVHYDSTSPPSLLFGDIIKVTYPRHRLDQGQHLAVVGTTINPYNKTMQIVAWGTT